MRHVCDPERRARLARRHGIAGPWSLSGPEEATAAMTVLHATEPATVYLSCRARVAGLDTTDVDRALYTDRALVKQLAMRRTLFVFPHDLLPAAWGSASARVAGQERRRLVKDVAGQPFAPDPDRWLREAEDAVRASLQQVGGLTAAQIREQVPEVAGRVTLAPGTSYGGDFPVAPRVLTILGAQGRVVRGTNTGHWRTSRPTWHLTADWLGATPEPLAEAAGYRELVRRWLHTFGPGTEQDLVWWLGSTKTAVRAALADLDAVQVSLDGGGVGFVLPEDVEPVACEEHWVALLPVLDATVMGWKERGFYLGDHAPQLFDGNGNAGTTVWVDGRAVGCWVQDADGVVLLRLLEPVSRSARRSLDAEARRLTEWLDGVRIGTVYPSVAMKNPAPLAPR